MNSIMQNETKNEKWRLIKSLMVCYAICILFRMRTSNVLYLMFGVMYYIVSKYEIVLEKRENLVKNILSVLFSCFVVLGNIDTFLDIKTWVWIIKGIFCFWGCYCSFSFLISNILVILRDAKFIQNDERNRKSTFVIFMISFISIICVWGIGLAMCYPGNTTKDSNLFFDMVVGERNMSAVVSPLYILAIRFCWNIGLDWFGNVNAGVALFSFWQICVFAFGVAYLICKLYSHNIRKSICFVIWLFYAIVPYNMQLSHTIWRDIPFSICVFLLFVFMWDLYMDNNIQSKLAEICKLIILTIAVIGMCILKANGLFVYVFMLPFSIYLFYKRNKKVVVTLIIAFVLTRVIQGPVTDELIADNTIWMNEIKAAVNTEVISTAEVENIPETVIDETETVEEVLVEVSPKVKVVETKAVANPPTENSSKAETVVDSQEKDSPKTETAKTKSATDSYNSTGIYIITAQQLARLVVEETNLSGVDYQRLSRIVDIEKVRESYDPEVNNILSAVNYNISSAEYLKEWMYFGFNYPIQYILAYKDLTLGYWYPDVQEWVYFNVIRENEYGLYKDSILTDIELEQMEIVEERYKEIPIYGLLWSIGFIVWMTLLFMGVTYIKKGLKEIFIYFPVLGVWATLLVAAPTFAEFRYMYALFLCLPLSILLPYMDERSKDENSKK